MLIVWILIFLCILYDSLRVTNTQKWTFVHFRLTLFMFWGTATTFIIIIYIHHIPYKLPVLKYIPLKESSSE